MKDEDKAKEQLINELVDLRREINELNDVAYKLEDFRLLYMKAPIPYQSLDENGRLLFANQAGLDTLGYSFEEVVGRWFGDFPDPDYIEKFKQDFPCFKTAGETNCVEFGMVRKDGTTFKGAFDGKISRDEKGNFKQTHCIFQNISDRKRAEEERIQLVCAIEQTNELIAKAWPLYSPGCHLKQPDTVH